MLFTEPVFFVFFLVVFGLHWALRGDRPRKHLLLVASYVFYAAWDWRFLGLIGASTLIDFFVAQRIQDAEERRRRAWLMVSLVANLGMLGLFKYYDFFIVSANSLLEMLGLDPGMRTLGIVLPVGISFYTFQTMSYTIDVYRRRMEPVRDLPDFALFVGFFPQLVMGPILRAVEFLPQLTVSKRWRNVPVKPLLTLFVIGFIKKACISDNIAPIVDRVFVDPAAFDVLSVWIACVYYAIVLYCDFSGYTDMAIAVAGLFGYDVPLNFDFPLLARNITEFWRRWHISFSSWMRDYLYFPLGGSRGGPLKTDRNLLITMLLSGLWHGAGMHFVVWGVLNGGALIVHRIWRTTTVIPQLLRQTFALLGGALTFYWFALTLIFFRAQSISEAMEVCRAFVLFDSVGVDTVSAWSLVFLGPLLAVHMLARRHDLPRLSARLPGPLYAAVLGTLSGLALAFMRTDYRPFIYFQF